MLCSASVNCLASAGKRFDRFAPSVRPPPSPPDLVTRVSLLMNDVPSSLLRLHLAGFLFHLRMRHGIRDHRNALAALQTGMTRRTTVALTTSTDWGLH